MQARRLCSGQVVLQLLLQLCACLLLLLLLLMPLRLLVVLSANNTKKKKEKKRNKTERQKTRVNLHPSLPPLHPSCMHLPGTLLALTISTITSIPHPWHGVCTLHLRRRPSRIPRPCRGVMMPGSGSAMDAFGRLWVVGLRVRCVSLPYRHALPSGRQVESSKKNLLSNRGTWRIARHQARHALGPTSRGSCHQVGPSAALRPLPVLRHAIPPTTPPPSQRAIDVRRPLFVSAQISPKTTAAARPSPSIGLA
ncbi:hypothetical protein IWX90DRAFT_249378 [Phyllosticta citrichinensis]|uniref:Secreted protein n=1 Tax=Phyllosticta citrichinensis TaxID=1130410 RepID=A0ABR1XR29_9PEZI